MTEYVVVFSNGEMDDHYLTTDVPYFLDVLTTNPDKVGYLCWSDDREKAKAFTIEEVQLAVHGVEAIQMVPDPNMKWEVK